mgnify:CR=1 FL=1
MRTVVALVAARPETIAEDLSGFQNEPSAVVESSHLDPGGSLLRASASG